MFFFENLDFSESVKVGNMLYNWHQIRIFPKKCLSPLIVKFFGKKNQKMFKFEKIGKLMKKVFIKKSFPSF